MALAGLEDIWDALADQIRSVYAAAITDLDVQVEPGMVFNATPPTVDVYPGTPGRDEASAAFDEINGGYNFVVRVRVAGDEDSQQRLLIQFMDDTNDLCVAAALYEDPTLNGLAASVDVGTPTGWQLYPDLTDKPLLGVQWPVLVIAGQS